MAIINSNLLDLTNTTPRVRAARFLKQWVLDGRLPAGERLPAESLLATKLNVSRSTVRLALSDLEKEGVVSTDKRCRVILDTLKPSQSSLSDAIALITDSPHRFERSKMHGTWHSNYIHTGAVDAIRDAGYDVLNIHPSRIAGERIQRLIVQRPRGVIILRKVLQMPSGQYLPQVLQEGNVPFVVYGDTPRVLDGKKTAAYDTVASDHQYGAYELTKWLIGQGRRHILRIWSLAVSEPDEKQHWTSQRDLGYERAMQEAGLKPMPALEIYTGSRESDAPSFQQQVRLMAGYLVEYLTQRKPMDAIMAGSDSNLPVVFGALKVYDLEPNRDILIVGYDNMWQDLAENSSELAVPAATVDKKNLAIGQELMLLLQQRIEGSLPLQGQHRVIRPELIILPPN